MKNIDMKKICTLVLFALCFFSCDEIIKIVIPNDPDPEPVVQVPVSLRLCVQDGEFVKGDCVGVYMSTYMDGKHVDLKAKGNHVDNNKFQYDGAGNWRSENIIYFKDDETPTDFYAYYPYITVNDATRHNISVPTDQSVEDNFKSADFMWGFTKGCIPSPEAVDITLHHIMSKAVIILKPGNGFTEEELISKEPTVRILNVRCNSTFNLGTGAWEPDTATKSLIPYRSSALEYRAILLPQNIENNEIVEVRVGEAVYRLRKTMHLLGGNEYTFTVTIQRTEAGVNVGVSSWDVVDQDFGGIVK